jgi:hypothetical protein
MKAVASDRTPKSRVRRIPTFDPNYPNLVPSTQSKGSVEIPDNVMDDVIRLSDDGHDSAIFGERDEILIFWVQSANENDNLTTNVDEATTLGNVDAREAISSNTTAGANRTVPAPEASQQESSFDKYSPSQLRAWIPLPTQFSATLHVIHLWPTVAT